MIEERHFNSPDIEGDSIIGCCEAEPIQLLLASTAVLHWANIIHPMTEYATKSLNHKFHNTELQILNCLGWAPDFLSSIVLVDVLQLTYSHDRDIPLPKLNIYCIKCHQFVLIHEDTHAVKFHSMDLIRNMSPYVAMKHFGLDASSEVAYLHESSSENDDSCYLDMFFGDKHFFPPKILLKTT